MRACSTHGKDEKCVKYFGGKPLREEITRKHRSRTEDKIRMDLREIGWKGVDWMHLAQVRVQSWALV
jgi:hypothetical protein